MGVVPIQGEGSGGAGSSQKGAVTWLKSYWLNHGQKTIATVLGSLALVDLTGYRDSIEAFLGAKGYAAIRLIGASAIIWRAVQANRAPNP